MFLNKCFSRVKVCGTGKHVVGGRPWPLDPETEGLVVRRCLDELHQAWRAGGRHCDTRSGQSCVWTGAKHVPLPLGPSLLERNVTSIEYFNYLLIYLITIKPAQNILITEIRKADGMFLKRLRKQYFIIKNRLYTANTGLPCTYRLRNIERLYVT